jgi:hypothetical protein
MLLTAARAALFHESVAGGSPELAVTVTEAARRLGDRSRAARAVADEALGRYREFAIGGVEPPAGAVSAMGDLVRRLPAYAEAPPPVRSGSGP